jgi:hypothetical protein
MRRSPRRHPAFLGPPEQFLDVPLPAESLHDPACAPDMAVCAKYAPAQTGPLQQAPSPCVDMPVERQPSVALFDLCYDELCQVLAL